ncbi:MAG: glycine cleavage system protein H [Planctomycetota bacterium]
MGEFEATFPRDRSYAKNHMWAQPREEDRGVWRFGLSAYAVRLLQDVYFLEWEFDPPHPLAERQMIGAIESKKAESDLYAPIPGTLTAINEVVLDDPSLINADPYGNGWLIEIRSDELEPTLLDPARYASHLDDAWDVAQKTIKGQANT